MVADSEIGRVFLLTSRLPVNREESADARRFSNRNPEQIAAHPHPFYTPIATFGSDYVLSRWRMG